MQNIPEQGVRDADFVLLREGVIGGRHHHKTGYNSRALAEFFQKLEKLVGNGGAQFLSDHLNPGNRVEALDREIANWPPKPYLSGSPEFVRAKQVAGEIKAFNAQQIADGAKSGQWAQQNRQSGAVPRDIEMADTAAGSAGTGTITNVSYQQVEPSGEFKTFQGNDYRKARSGQESG